MGYLSIVFSVLGTVRAILDNEALFWSMVTTLGAVNLARIYIVARKGSCKECHMIREEEEEIEEEEEAVEEYDEEIEVEEEEAIPDQ
jgi:hypothetical protein